MHGLRKDWQVLRHNAAAAALHPDAIPEDTIDACYDHAPELFRTRANALVGAVAVQGDKVKMESHLTLQHLPHIRLRQANTLPNRIPL